MSWTKVWWAEKSQGLAVKEAQTWSQEYKVTLPHVTLLSGPAILKVP